MKKLVRGILDFRKNLLPERREMFARLANVQTPDVLFITCSDSRVAPNWFASTDPGDLFVVRNVGNIVPPCNNDGMATDHSVAAAIDFAVTTLKVRDIVVCGHSGCGAIHALAGGIEHLPDSNLKNWLGFAKSTAQQPSYRVDHASDLNPEDKLSQKSVLQQIQNLKSYPKVRERMASKELCLHAWWFDIGRAGVYAYDQRSNQFILIDDQVVGPLFPEACL